MAFRREETSSPLHGVPLRATPPLDGLGPSFAGFHCELRLGVRERPRASLFPVDGHQAPEAACAVLVLDLDCDHVRLAELDRVRDVTDNGQGIRLRILLQVVDRLCDLLPVDVDPSALINSAKPEDNLPSPPGPVWWGAYGEGDRIVDLPLKLGKIIVERRTHAMYVNDPQPASGEDVLLGDLYAEYKTAPDKTEDAVRRSRLRMPVPEGVPELGNPIAGLAAAGLGDPLPVASVTLPDQWQDGTRCYVHFGEIEGAEHYDVWVSPYEDGRGALCLGPKWAEPGKLIRGLRPDTDFYVFVAYTDKDGKPSKPSKPLKVRLQDRFPNK